MPVDPISAGLAIAGPILGGLFGDNQAAYDKAQAREMAKEAAKRLTEVGIPPAESMQITLKYLSSVGKLTPELEESINQQDTELKNIELDPRSKEAQFRALSELEELGDGGMRLSDEAAMADAMGNVQTKSRGAREAIDASMKARGAFGSGAELASKLAAQQDADAEANEIGLKTAAGAQDRALQAIIQAGELGGNLRAADFGEQKAIADAQDQINAFNTANSRDTVARNVAAKNAANQFNLMNEQRIGDENVGTANKEQIYNKELKQKEFENTLQKEQSVANALTQNASQLSKDASNTAAKWAGVGQGVGEIGASLIDKGDKKPGLSNMGPGSMSGVDKAYTNPQDEERYWA